jgi:Uma2 family endonuclease
MQPVFESIDIYSIDEFERWLREQEERGDINHYELLNGRIVMTPPAGWPHGSVEGTLVRELGAFVHRHGLGRLFGSSQGFVLPGGHVVEPDVSFVSTERWNAAPPPVAGKFLEVVPDLVIEILSPSTSSRDRGEKLMLYAQAGVREYWIVNYNLRRVSVWQQSGEGLSGPATVEGDEEMVRSQVVAGFELSPADIFE